MGWQYREPAGIGIGKISHNIVKIFFSRKKPGFLQHKLAVITSCLKTVVAIGNFRSQGFAVRLGSMGKAAPGFTVALLDDAGIAVPDGVEGEIALRAAPERPLGLFREYWKNPTETAAHFKGDWYLTGDRGHKGSGRLLLVCRAQG